MKIGFIGLGIMGQPMSQNIVKKHDDAVYVFDCVKEKVDLLVSCGAIGCASCREVAQKSDVILSMVPRSEHSLCVYTEILECLHPGKICIDMSTIDPAVSRKIAEMVNRTGARFADAPVVKSKPAAIAGTLGIYVGCDAALYDTIRPILRYIGENILRMGENGAGLIMKICHNTLVAQIQNGVNETLLLAQQNGIDVDAFTTAISYGGGQNFYLDSKAAVLKTHDFTTAFSVENMAKDLEICRKMALENGLTLPGAQAAQKVYEKALEMGLEKEDFSATIKAAAALL